MFFCECMARVATTRETCARSEFNLCPMCWMPLYLDQKKPADLSWELVQVLFKGKPAFSIEADGYKHERPKLVFGISRLHPGATSNCQDCHFIHESVFTQLDRFVNPWDRDVVNGEPKRIDNVRDLTIQMTNFGYSVEDIPSFHAKISVRDGLWTGVCDFLQCFPEGNPTDGGVERNMAHFSQNEVMKTIMGTFAGCRDCNSKMTVNSYILPLFTILTKGVDLGDVEAEPEAGRNKSKRKRVKVTATKVLKKDQGVADFFDDEKMMFYVLLCGMIEEEDAIFTVTLDPGDSYSVVVINDGSRCASWRFRFVLLWCLLQILFSVWENAKTSPVFRHHLSYVYEGIQDFYLSFILFSLHCANGRFLISGSHMQFSTFHFFYSSHLPFFLMGGAGNPHSLNSLSGLILEGCRFNFQRNKGDVRRQFDQIKQKIKLFWMSHVKPLSDFLHGRADVGQYANFFCTPVSATSMTEQSTRIPLDVESFSRYFTGGPGYWFHFKTITMRNIEADCGLYFNTGTIPTVNQVWAQWYGQLCSSINHLGAPAVHLSAVLREIGGGGRSRRIPTPGRRPPKDELLFRRSLAAGVHPPEHVCRSLVAGVHPPEHIVERDRLG